MITIANPGRAPDTAGTDVVSVSDRGRAEGLAVSNDSRVGFPGDCGIHHLIEEQVRRTPNATAVILAEERLAYRELDARADTLAGVLQKLGVGPDVLVGICAERTIEMIIGVLAILKAGGAYVPLDPSYPTGRLKLMLENARVPILLTQTSLRGMLAFELPNLQLLCLDEKEWPSVNRGVALASVAATQMRMPLNPASLAYIIHTSGSTGAPKAVAIEHRHAVNFICWAQGAFTAEELAGVLFSTSLCFDLSVFELFVTLSVGGKVILARNALELPELPARNEVTLINTVPSAAAELVRLQAIPPSTRVMNLAGEPLKTALVDKLYALGTLTKVHDLYGPTETTTYSTYALRQAGAPATVGRPIANTQIHLLDEHRQPVPLGEIGEIYIGGAGVARGYLHRPDLTAERFVPDRFSGETQARLYKTGDVARWQPDGNLEFLGRLDHQIKIRGYRIELGEIEIALAMHPKVQECVVVAREDRPDEKRLVAYFVSGSNPAAAEAELRRFLHARLPDYMLPSAFVMLEALPLTSNGKVDRKRLPAPQLARPELSESFAPPRNRSEQTIAQHWLEVLGLERIGIHDNFFELGGDSLQAVRIVARLRQAFEVAVPVAAVFESPTIALLADGLAAARWGKVGVPESPITRARDDLKIPLSFSQQRLWCIAQLAPGSFAYNMPIAVRLEGTLDADLLRDCLEEIVGRHEILRTTFTATNGEPEQTIWPRSGLGLPLVDLSRLPAFEGEAEALRLALAEAQRPFDLFRGPLIRCILLRLDACHHELIVVMHHIVSDGWSLSVFLGELATLWERRVTGGSAPLSELPIQYGDYATRQRLSADDLTLAPHSTHWKQTLAGAPPSLKLPTDLVGSDEQPPPAGRRVLVLSNETAILLRNLNRRCGTTSFMTLLTALMVTLNRWTRQADIVVGTVSAGRTRRETEGLIGCFMNFLPIRAALRELDSGLEILARVKEAVLIAHAHLDFPFEKIVAAVNPERGLALNPIYNIGFLVENFPKIVLRTPHLTGRLRTVEVNAALLDLRFIADDSEPGITLTCEYRADLFEAQTIQHLVNSYGMVLETLLQAPETHLSSFTILPALAEQSRRHGPPPETIVVTATFTAEPLGEPLEFWLRELELPAQIYFAPYNQIFQQLLHPTTLPAPNAPCLNVVLVRMEDWALASGHLSTPVADFAQKIERTLGDLISALQSAAKRSPAPFLLCICPSSKALAREPQQAEFFRRMHQRLASELSSATSVHLIFPDQLAALYPVETIYDPSGDELGHVPYTADYFTALATMIARVFNAQKRPGPKVIVLDCDHTLWSGVCGEDGPEGIQLSDPHRALQEFMRAQLDAGRLLCLCSKNIPQDVHAVFEHHQDMPLKLNDFAATRINWLPKSENLKALARELNVGVESLVLVDDNPVECAEVVANCPTAAVLQLPEASQLIPQILQHCWLFDRQAITVEDAHRTDYYRQDRDRTQARGESLSLAEFLAQLDLQIGIRELSPDQNLRAAQLTLRTNQFNCTTRRRTEAEIHGLPASSKTLVVSVSDRFGDYGLVGLVIWQFEPDLLSVETFLLSCRALGRGVEHQMLAHLGRLAVAHGAAYVDVHFVVSAKNQPAMDFLECVGGPFRQALNGGYVFRIPAGIAAKVAFEPGKLTTDLPAVHSRTDAAPRVEPRSSFARWRWLALEASQVGKIQALIAAKTGTRKGSATASPAPETELQSELCRIWQELLRIDRIGVRDDFFDLGGHSLLAVRLFARIEQQLHVKLPIVTIFQARTIELLAHAIEQPASKSPDSGLLPIQSRGSRPPLFLVHGAGGDVLWGYANLAAHGDPDQPIYGVQADDAGEFATIEAMAAHYVAKIRAFQPVGPYSLGGYCFGGNVAQEMAGQLEARGEKIALLALLDCASSNSGYETPDWWRPAWVLDFARNLAHWLEDFMQLKPEERRSLVLRKARTLPRKVWRRAFVSPAIEDPDLEEFIDVAHVSEREVRLWKNHLGLLSRHVSKPYGGHLTLFRTRSHPLLCSFEQDLGWRNLAARVTVKHIPGSHEGIFVEPHVRFLARELEQSLRASQALPGSPVPV